MSDEKPFAIVATIADNQYAVIVDHRRVMFGNELYAYEESAFLNTAVANERRKAAARALREAADAEDKLATRIERNLVSNAAHYRRYPGGKPGALQAAREKREAAQRLRTRAAEAKGET